MTSNTPVFAEFIKSARSEASLTQDNLNERGAPYRQMQGKVENGELHELESSLLAQYDRAFGWPRGYAGAVAQAAAYGCGDLAGSVLDEENPPTRNCQYLWIGVFQATSVSVDSAGSGGVMSAGRSSSLPLWKTAPARTRATRWGALTARHRACAASISL